MPHAAPPPVAFVWPGPIWDDHLTKEYLIPLALHELGSEICIYCVENRFSVSGPVPVREVAEPDMASADFWRKERVTQSLVCTWTGYPEIVRALRQAGATVVAKSDSDGVVSVRDHPLEYLRRMVLLQETTRERAIALVEWLLRLGPRYRIESGWITESYQEASAVIIESEPARRSYLEYLGSRLGEIDSAKVHVIPNGIGRHFTRATIPPSRERLVVAVGRWEHPAKDARLMSATVRRFLGEDVEARVAIVGRRGDEAFSGLDDFRFQYLGVLPNEALVGLYGRARVILSTSRWEGAPTAPHEALAMGCTFVGPRLPAYRDIAASGAFGTLAKARTVRGLVKALHDEFAKWDVGLRDPVKVARCWRPRVDSHAVAGRLLELLRSPSRHREPIAQVESRDP